MFELLDSCGDSARGMGYPSLEPQCHSLGKGFIARPNLYLMYSTSA
jgi:hypothetical protein